MKGLTKVDKKLYGTVTKVAEAIGVDVSELQQALLDEGLQTREKEGNKWRYTVTEAGQEFGQQRDFGSGKYVSWCIPKLAKRFEHLKPKHESNDPLHRIADALHRIADALQTQPVVGKPCSSEQVYPQPVVGTQTFHSEH